MITLSRSGARYCNLLVVPLCSPRGCCAVLAISYCNTAKRSFSAACPSWEAFDKLTSPWSSGKCVRFGASRSRPGLTKTLEIGTVAFSPGAQCTEELQGTQPEHRNQTEWKLNSEVVQTQSWRYKTIVVIKRQQQTTISNKQTNR